MCRLDSAFDPNQTVEQMKHFSSLDNCRRRTPNSIPEFLKAFDKRLQKLKESSISLPDKVVAFMLLRNSNLPQQDVSEIIQTLCDYDFDMTYSNVKSLLMQHEKKQREMCSNDQSNDGNIVMNDELTDQGAFENDGYDENEATENDDGQERKPIKKAKRGRPRKKGPEEKVIFLFNN